MHPNFKKFLLHTTHSNECEEAEIIQSLWSNYGKISRYLLAGSAHKTVVVKHISLAQSSSHPRGWNTSNSHNRKVKSYQVETHWYTHWNQLGNTNCRTPKFLGSFCEEENQWIVLEDLDVEFPLRKQNLNLTEVKVCLGWLANFHATFLNKKPEGLWDIGTYWHLKTRPDELGKLENRDLKAKAHLMDDILNNCQYKTIVHGDAKVANFCFSNKGNKVAAVDFQYVGGGCGMKDVAYFLGSCLSSSECEKYESELLDFYFEELIKAVKINSINTKELEQEWRELYPFAVADFTRFLLGWMPSHQKVNRYNLDKMERVLGGL